jgi:PAS domain S-box-containing protein
MDILLRKSWKAAAEIAETPLILTDNRGTILDVNIAFCKMSGFTLEDLEGTIPPYPFSLPGCIDELYSGEEGEKEGVEKATIRLVCGDVLSVSVESTRLQGTDSDLISLSMRPGDRSPEIGKNVLAMDTGALLDAFSFQVVLLAVAAIFVLGPVLCFTIGEPRKRRVS